MDKHKDNGILLVQNKGVKYGRKENTVDDSVFADRHSLLKEDIHFDTQTASEDENLDKETELYNTVYKEISEIVGLDATLKIYLRFKGQQISFPVRLYNPNMIQQKVIKEFDGMNIRELAKKYDYSEKTIRRMIRDSVEDINEESPADDE